MNLDMDPVIAHVLYLGLAVLFLAACAHKLRDAGAFRAALENYRLLPVWLVGPAVYVVIALEAAGAVGVLFAPTRGPALVLVLLLLVTYAAAIAINLLRGRRHIDCGCNGPGRRQSISAWMVLRNALLALVAAVALLPIDERALGWLDWTTVVLGVTAAMLLYAALNQLIASAPNLQSLRG